jgi:hypothetical protein
MLFGVEQRNIPRVGSPFFGVSADSPTDAWAVGTRIPRGGGEELLAMHWDGVGWSETRTPPVDASFLAAEAITPDDIWAAGSVFTTETGLLPLTMHSKGCR